MIFLLTAERYQRLTRPLRRHPALLRAILLTNRCVTALLYAAYPLLLVCLLWQGDERFQRALLVPGVSFALLSAFRHRVNAPRPYEVLDIEPLIRKNTKGHSFPSRHVFSAAIISLTFLYCGSPVGYALLGCTLFLALVRVVGGVHFPRDVLAGALIGLLCGGLGFWV